MSVSSHVVPCQRCGGYKVSERVSWVTRGRRKLTLVLVVLMVTMVTAFRLHRCYSRAEDKWQNPSESRYDRGLPLVFIGGVPRSGTSLVRALLDAHPEVRCGPDTRVIPHMLLLYEYWLTNDMEYQRLQEAGVHRQVLDEAVAALCLEVIVHHGDAAPHLCNKDPHTLQHADRLLQLFPNAKFLLVVRDARATVHSIISRQVDVDNFDRSSYQHSVEQWNISTGTLLEQCLRVGSRHCRLVRYEQLVLSPRQELASVLAFLDIPWHESVLHHEALIGKPGGIRLSRYEQSSAEVRRAIHLTSLTRWVGRFPEDVLQNLSRLAPVMARLGYDPADPNPDYHSLRPWSPNNVTLDVDDT